MRITIVRTVAAGTVVGLGFAAVAFTPAYATMPAEAAAKSQHVATLVDPIAVPTRPTTREPE
jgi:hypothetical protein